MGGNQGFNRADGAGSKVTNEFLPWQLFIAGPDEQGEMTRLIAQAKNFGMTVSSQQLTVNGERLAVNRKRSSVSSEGLEEKEHERDGNKRLTAYRLPFTDIVFTGPVYGEEKMRLMATADLFVLPTRSENFGIVVAEALACGVPVITTKGAPWAELENCVSALVPDCVTEGVVENKAIRQSGNKACQPGRAGWWIDIGVEPLVEALKEAMSLTDEERRAMGENGRKLVESKYQWTEVARKMAGVYEKCVNAGLR